MKKKKYYNFSIAKDSLRVPKPFLRVYITYKLKHRKYISMALTLFGEPKRAGLIKRKPLISLLKNFCYKKKEALILFRF